MDSKAFARIAREIAESGKTIYASGVIGSVISEKLIRLKTAQYPYWYTKNKIKNRFAPLYGKNIFGFDCVCLVKAILWGWNGDTGAPFGGATYKKDGIPDFTTAEMIEKYSSEVSEDFEEDIGTGEVLWMRGHVGIYVGDGLSVECTSSWNGKVMLTACNRDIEGYHRRNWKKHGRLNFVTYPTEPKTTGITCTRQILKKGAKDGDVALLQFLLNYYGAELEIDGSFGAKTEEALLAYQTAHGLEADGSCGKKTWTELLKGGNEA